MRISRKKFTILAVTVMTLVGLALVVQKYKETTTYVAIYNDLNQEDSVRVQKFLNENRFAYLVSQNSKKISVRQGEILEVRQKMLEQMNIYN